MPRSAKRKPAIHVAIVSDNPETIDGLQSYFSHACVPSHSTRALSNLDVVAPACATAAIIFPDDFAESDVLGLIRTLGRVRPDVLALIVTREPGRFRSVIEADGQSPSSLILPKPSFGWDILDAIRAHAAGPESS